MLCGQAGQEPTQMMQEIPVTNYDFETFTNGQQNGVLQNGQWVHFGNSGNSGLDGDIEIAGWVAHEYDDGQCTYENSVQTDCKACTTADGESCGQGLFHQPAGQGGAGTNHAVSIGVNILFLNSGYVTQQLSASVQADTTYIITCEVGGGNGQSNGGYYFGFYTASGTQLAVMSHQIGGPPASADHFVSASVTFDAADHPEAIGQPLVVRLGKDQDGQAQYHSVTCQQTPTGISTTAGSFCSAQTTSAGFCGASGQNQECTQSTNDPTHGNTGGTNGYGQVWQISFYMP
jgi:hypothetical protein